MTFSNFNTIFYFKITNKNIMSNLTAFQIYYRIIITFNKFRLHVFDMVKLFKETLKLH